jgi:hypothetical protein
MLVDAIPVLREIHKRFPDGGADLESICGIITGVTHIDRVHYTSYNVPRANPFWGSFKRYEQMDAPYADKVTVVHVRYAQHLTDGERVFIVSKELCHSLSEPEGAHAVTDAAVDDLVAAFSILTSATGISSVPDVSGFTLEILATITATEMVCPLRRRRKIMEDAGEDPDWDAVGSQVRVPAPYLRVVCALSHMTAVEKILRSFGLA